MIFFRLPKNRLNSDEFIFKCSQKGLLLNAMSKDRIRLVTHLDVNEEDVEIASSIIAGVLSI